MIRAEIFLAAIRDVKTLKTNPFMKTPRRTGQWRPIWTRMKGSAKRWLLVGPLLFALVNIIATARAQQFGEDVENGRILALIDKYAKSVSQADTNLASEVWSTNEAVSFIHPKGSEHSWDQVRTNVYERLMGATFIERKLTVHDVSIHLDGDMAWAEFRWDFSAKLRTDGSLVSTRGRETQIYRKNGRGWRIVHVHYSGMPAGEKGQVSQ